jgi:type III secretion protein N (ATPase)
MLDRLTAFERHKRMNPQTPFSSAPVTPLGWAVAQGLASQRQALQRCGVVQEVAGTLIRAVGIDAGVGQICELRIPAPPRTMLAEVIGVTPGSLLLMPFGHTQGIGPRTEVVRVDKSQKIPVGPELLGRVIDAFGAPVDGLGPLSCQASAEVQRTPPQAMKRQIVSRPLVTGVRAIDALNTVGAGQRMGIFAPAGVGKSTLITMLVKGSSAAVNVVALVGERGREVREFVEHALGPAGLARACVVVATSDAPPGERVRAALTATTIAEYFRDQGLDVTLVVDSLTRFARAQREIGLACGEPPTRRGFTPSVFAALPSLLERAGPSEHGSITGFYTILNEDDESADPIGEEVRSIVDGHLVLSRKLSERGQFPAIDVLASLSRLMSNLVDPTHAALARKLRSLLSKHQEIELLLQLGEYRPGFDRLSDEAVGKIDAIRAFLAQGSEDNAPVQKTLSWLQQIVDSELPTVQAPL